MNATAALMRSMWAVALLATVPGLAQMATALGAPAPVAIAETARPEAPPVSRTPKDHELAEPLDASLPEAPTPAVASGGGSILPSSASASASQLPPCPKRVTAQTPRCLVNPYQRFLDGPVTMPLTAGQKGYLALRNFVDPANAITITGIAAFTVGFNAHTAYGPGLKGFMRDTAYTFSQDATGELFGTFLIPALTHEDPRYHREPHAPVGRRLLHALSRTLIAQSDTGRNMPNYAVLMTYPISAEASNLYVPGVAGNGPSTARRILTGLATDPANNLITEFLPDVARHVNIRVIFVQRIVNMMTAGNAMGGAASE